MAAEKRSTCCIIFSLGLLALFCHLAGFVTPGWLKMRTSVYDEQTETSFIRLTFVENADMINPSEDDGQLENFRRKRSETDVKIEEEGILEENEEFVAWVKETSIKVTVYEVTTNYGLWYSTFCLHEKMDHDDKKKHESSSSEDDDDKRGKKGHCHCKKISTKCALYNSFIYDDPMDYINPGPRPARVLSTRNFAYATLTEQRAEGIAALVLLVLGLISAIGGFRKANGCKCAAVLTVLFMLAAALVAIVPVSRFSHYSVDKHSQNVPVKVGVPYSVIATGVGALFSLITALVASCGLSRFSKKEQAGKWYQFNNELELPSEKEKNGGLVFITTPLPEKPGAEIEGKEPIA